MKRALYVGYSAGAPPRLLRLSKKEAHSPETTAARYPTETPPRYLVGPFETRGGAELAAQGGLGSTRKLDQAARRLGLVPWGPTAQTNLRTLYPTETQPPA